MKKNLYKLVVIDIDGTLLNNNEEITDFTRDAIKNVVSNNPNVTIMLATGRSYFASHFISKLVNLEKGLIICSNGGVLSKINEYQPLYVSSMPTLKVQTLLDYTKGSNIQSIAVLDDGESLIANHAFKNSHFSNNWFIAKNLINRNVDNSDHVLQCCIKVPNEILSQVVKFINENLNFEIYYYPNRYTTYIEVNETNTNKWLMIDRIAKYRNINHSEIIAIGNGNNDIKMIKNSGLGIAVSNAEKEVLKTADRIIASNEEDGVAKFLLEIFAK